MTDEQKIFDVAVESYGEGGHAKFTMHTADGTVKALDTPLAKEYAENLLLRNDVRECLAAMECWERRFASKSDPEDRLIGASLFRDAITQFVGCFDKRQGFLSRLRQSTDVILHEQDRFRVRRDCYGRCSTRCSVRQACRICFSRLRTG
jgi:hypothetical protein